MLITNLVANGACVSLGTLISVYGKIAQKVYYTICYTYDQFNIKVSNTCILLQEQEVRGSSRILQYVLHLPLASLQILLPCPPSSLDCDACVSVFSKGPLVAGTGLSLFP